MKRLNLRWTIGAAIVFGVFCLISAVDADTIMMKNGVQIEGVVGRETNGMLEVQVGTRTIRVRKEEINQIEKNEKDGKLDLEAMRQEAEIRDKALTEEMGLDRTQRELVLKYINDLTSATPTQSSEARRALLAMGAKMNLFPFIEFLLPSYLPNTIYRVLKILPEIDPVKTQPLARHYVFFPEENIRGLTLELLATAGSEDVLELAMRGMLDHTDTVRCSACKSLASLMAKEATPLLIRNFNHKDLRVQNNARQALSQIWHDELQQTSPETLESWESFWRDHEGAVPQTINIETLEPLVAEGTHFPGC